MFFCDILFFLFLARVFWYILMGFWYIKGCFLVHFVGEELWYIFFREFRSNLGVLWRN